MAQVALFLRGINLGKARRIAMGDLRALLEDAGYEDVRTLLASGNVVVSTAKTAAAIRFETEGLIEDRFGFDVPVVVRTGRALRKMVAADPLGDVVTEPKWYSVFLLGKPLTASARRAIEAVDTGDEEVALARNEVFVWSPRGVQDSPLYKEVATATPDLIPTVRNWNTLTKVLSAIDG